MKRMFLITITICSIFVCYVFSEKVRFVFDPAMYVNELKGIKIETVSVAGTFNNWNPNKDFLKLKDNIYVLEMDLPEGLYYYKFVVNGSRWFEDVTADKSLRKEDGYGGFNSGIYVGETGYRYGTAKDNDINEQALKQTLRFISEDIIEIKFRCLKDDVDDVKIVWGTKQNKEIVEKLQKVDSKIGFDYYTLYTFFDESYLGYYYVLKDKKVLLYYTKDGLSEIKPQQKNLFHIPTKKLPKLPSWAKGCIWYQIMIDRFYNGDTTNDPDNVLPWRMDFSKRAPNEKGEFYSFVWGRKFGGDLQGVMKKLPYLKELGVEAIYFNPVFKADSYHKYDTKDYRHIDDHFGYKGDYELIITQEDYEDPTTWKFSTTDKLFLDFIKQAHQNDIKVIIDGVFNHSGEKFWAFEDLKKNLTRSKYKDWYIVTNWDIFSRSAHLGKGYIGWAGFGGLPEFREDTNGLIRPIKEHIFYITQRWMDPNNDGDPSDGIDGWRLDVPDCIAQPFWVEWCKLVRQINPNAYIVGELWTEAKDWISEELFDAQMNYPLAKLIIKFFVDKSLTPSQFDKKLKELVAVYPFEFAFVQMNVIDTHDTDRLVSMIYNPYREFDKKNRLNPRDGDYNPNYKPEKPTKKEYQIQKLIEVFRFTYLGSPHIWYGTEVGMWGSDDPFNRKPMLWKELEPYEEEGATVDEELLEYYKKLISIRKKYPVLKTGLFSTVLVDDKRNIYAYHRYDKHSNVVVIINNSDKSQKVKIEKINGYENTKYFDPFDKKQKVYKYPIVADLKPYTGKILLPISQ